MAKKKIEVDEDMLKEIMAGDIPIFGRTKQKENASPPAESKPAEVVETPTEEKPLVAMQEKVSVKPKKRKEDSCDYRKMFLTEEDKRELMEPEGIVPDPDFDTSMTYEEMNNVVDVLNSDTHSDENGLRAAQTIFHKLPGTELLRLIENELADQQKIDILLHDYLDELGRPLPESKRRERKIKDFNIRKYV